MSKTIVIDSCLECPFCSYSGEGLNPLYWHCMHVDNPIGQYMVLDGDNIKEIDEKCPL
jgi:hypothetical protein